MGWFLVGAATAELDQASAREELARLTVRDVMTPDPVTVPGSVTVEELLSSEAIRRRHATFPLTGDDGQPTGLVTFTRIRQVPPQARAATKLRDIACPVEQVTRLRPDEPAADVLPRLSECAEGRALVVGPDGHLAGIVAPSDVTRALQWLGLPRSARSS
jgi:CBS-domain-containing membrane protein